MLGSAVRVTISLGQLTGDSVCSSHLAILSVATFDSLWKCIRKSSKKKCIKNELGNYPVGFAIEFVLIWNVQLGALFGHMVIATLYMHTNKLPRKFMKDD